MTDAWPWESMIAEFAALGGVADNVRPGEGEFGPGLVPIDPSRRVRLYVPPHLLIGLNQVRLEEGALRIKREAPVGERVRQFFERYQAVYSWGAAGQRESAAFIEALEGLPADIRRLLIDEFKMGELFPERPLRAIGIFLQSRTIGVRERRMIMPVLELVNHSSQEADFVVDDSVTLEGLFDGEVLAAYYTNDAIGMFRGWAFASPEPVAFSLPLTLAWGGRSVTVERKLEQSYLGQGVQMPNLHVEGNTITLSHLLLGNRIYPELPNRIFARLMKKAKVEDAGALFNEIHRLNRVKVETLLAALDAHQGAGVALLRATGKYQLEALAACIDPGRPT